MATVMRSIAILLGVGLLALIVGVVLTLLDASYSHGGRLPFSFKYKGLYRTTPDPGGYVKVVRRSGGSLEDSYAVAPLRLGVYHGSVTAELPLFAIGYIYTLASRFSSFRLEQEGKTRISSTLGGYDVRYSAFVDGRKVYGRDVMLLPEPRGAREGVVIEMLTSQRSGPSNPVASKGVLEKPLKTFSFG
jgi:hypothetical protein